MKTKKIVIGIALLLVGTSMIPAIAQDIHNSANPISKENWLYVGGSGPGNYTRIQDALDNSSDGDTIFVYDALSPYYENLVINKSVMIIGENRNTTVIDGGSNENGFVIKIYANDVKIQGFTIQHYNESVWPKTAIWINSSECQISHNIFRDNSIWAMYFYCYSHNIISDNYLENCSEGISFQESNNNIIENNVFIGCKVNDIYAGGNNYTITGNRFEQGGGIILPGSRYTNIYNNSFYNESTGIESSSYFVNIYNNVFLYNGYAITLDTGSHSNCIFQNTINKNVNGILLFYASDNNITHNTIYDNNFTGITVEYSQSNIIAQNIIAHQDCGICLEGSSFNKIEKNILQENNKGLTPFPGGLEIVSDSFGNQILNNTFKANKIDARLVMILEYDPPSLHYLITHRNQWDSNYWNRPRIIPKPIFGIYGKYSFVSLFIQFDWHPALKPYDIPGMGQWL